MAKNEVFKHGSRITLPVPAGVKSGDPVVVGGIKGVALDDRDTDGQATLWCEGVYTIPVSDAVTTVGQPVYHPGDGTTRSASLTNASSGNTLFGYALETKSATSAPIRVAIARY